MFESKFMVMNGRVIYKSYILLVPLALYLIFMYRILENTCQDSQDLLQNKKLTYVPSESKSRKIMQLRFKNETNNLDELVHEIKRLENQRSHIEDILRHIRSTFIMNEKVTQKINALNEEKDTKKISLDVVESLKPRSSKYIINCTNIHRIKLKSKIGHGVSKQTFEGDFYGLPVAVKMVTRHQSEVKNCINAINSSDPKRTELRSRCFVFPTMKLMKEILLLEQLNHAGFAKLLGYCVRSEESETSDLSERGVVSVFELGQRLMFGNLQLATWQERIHHAVALANFLYYLETSPLGSLRVRDFKEVHFLMVKGNIKMIDLDDVDNVEPNCDSYVINSNKYPLSNKGCEFNLPCRKGMCIGFNAKQNLKYMNKIFFKRLLYPSMFPKSICEEIGALNADIDSHIVSALDISERLKSLQAKALSNLNHV